MGLEKHKTFEMPEATRPQTPEFEEVHAIGYVEMDEERIRPTREAICSEFNIHKDGQCVRPVTFGYQRKIRSFLIIKNKENPKNIYYAEGNAPHADLLDDIINKAGAGLKSRREIQEDVGEFDKFWETKKGFIDPFANGFKNYPELRKKLERLQKEKAEKEEKKCKEEIPDWFLSAES